MHLDRRAQLKASNCLVRKAELVHPSLEPQAQGAGRGHAFLKRSFQACRRDSAPSSGGILLSHVYGRIAKIVMAVGVPAPQCQSRSFYSGRRISERTLLVVGALCSDRRTTRVPLVWKRRKAQGWRLLPSPATLFHDEEPRGTRDGTILTCRGSHQACGAHHVHQRRSYLFPFARLQAAIGIDPNLIGGQTLHRLREQLGYLLDARAARRVDVVDARTNLVRIAIGR